MRPPRLSALFSFALVVVACGLLQAQVTPPKSTTPPDPKPDVDKGRLPLRPAPNLAAATTLDAVDAFVNWASASTMQQSDEVRRTIAAASKNAFAAKALCDELARSQKVDHSRSVILLSILGELHAPGSTACLVNFLHQPFPQKGTVIDGEIVEQTALGTLQAKAVDGIAFQHTPEGDKEVLNAVAQHPSRIVRAEAIDAYLWNHGDSADARATLSKVVKPDEKIFLSRIRRVQGQSAADFNRQLDVYMKAHPEVAPPAPEPAKKETRPKQGVNKDTGTPAPPR
ncbi:MAG TPA: hypothetical protein VGN16_25945 [Acidobacteriaceae bacterium]|jgi:hypothetical protein